jgi:probable phosphoglycerate mutase
VLSLFLLRHGETEFSRGDRFCGDIDAPLTATGLLMGEHFANAYGALTWRAIVTSTRRRTISTAEPLAVRTALSIHRDVRLDEMYFGDWQGLTKREAAARDPARYDRWRANPTVGAPSGESPLEASDRALAAIADLRARFDSGNVLVVSHKTVLRLLFCRLLNIDLRFYRDTIDWPTGAVSVLDIGPRGVVARLVVDERHLFPQPRRHLVSEQNAGWGEAEPGLVDDDPAGSDGAGDLDIAADGGIDPMTGAMSGAIDPIGRA